MFTMDVKQQQQEAGLYLGIFFQVMGVIADLESFPDPNPAAHRPDYRAIYKYLGALLAGRGSEELLLSMSPLGIP